MDFKQKNVVVKRKTNMKIKYIIYVIVVVLIILGLVYISFKDRKNEIKNTNEDTKNNTNNVNNNNENKISEEIVNIEYNKITFEEMDNMIINNKLNNYIILDVRTKEEYESGRIKNSILIPDYEIENVLNEIPDKSTYIFVYCRSGNRSKTATLKMNNMGYQNVYDVGGINSYKGEIITSN